MQAKPFLKCAGGKKQLLREITARLPDEIRESQKIEHYVEPFLGGGAVFFHLKEHFKIGSALLLDNNPEFILGYQVVQENVRKLIKELQKIETAYRLKSIKEQESCFYAIRDEFNRQRSQIDFSHYNPDWITRAAWLIFLNKTCFNGLSRQNRNGDFNVPFGRYKNPCVCQTENLLAVNHALQNVKLKAADFSEAGSSIQLKSLVYFDPPYRPLSKTASFTAYSRLGFDDENQIRLSQFFEQMHTRGAWLILSNSDPQNENPNDNFFDELYHKFHVERIAAARMINSDGQKRGKIQELLIRNYR